MKEKRISRPQIQRIWNCRCEWGRKTQQLQRGLQREKRKISKKFWLVVNTGILWKWESSKN